MLSQPLLSYIPTNRTTFKVVCCALFFVHFCKSYTFPANLLLFILEYMFMRCVLSDMKMKEFFSRYAISGFTIITIMLLLGNIIAYYLGPIHNYWFFGSIISTWISIDRFSFLVLLDAVFFLFVFSKLRPFYNKYLNNVAKTMFGVYLFHECGIFKISEWLPKMLPVSNVFLSLIICTTIIMVGGITIEYLRSKFFL